MLFYLDSTELLDLRLNWNGSGNLKATRTGMGRTERHEVEGSKEGAQGFFCCVSCLNFRKLSNGETLEARSLVGMNCK